MKLEQIKARMHTGGLYFCNDENLMAEQLQRLELLYEFNTTRPTQQRERRDLLRKMFAEIGEDCYIEPPFHANWGGKHVHFGDGVYANFNLTLVDDTHIYVGDHVLFGPNVTICAATHPIHPDLRRAQAQYNRGVRIGDNVWIGGNSMVLPGVTIGANTVIGAGSLVTKDIPADAVAFGSPCRVKRKIDERDLQYYEHDRAVDLTLEDR